jgi:murein DD-endopeptidase MepM/ murein hydrolase activator NlpD
MQIILFREKRGRVRSQGISRSVLATIAVVVLAGLLGDAYLLARYFDKDLLDEQVIATWRDRLSAQQIDVDRIQTQSRIEMDAVGRRLATMQARLLRMEALGERLTDVAKLDSDEFRFQRSPALGGPETSPIEGNLVVADFDLAVEALSEQLKTRGNQLSVLESLLTNRKFHQDVALAGRPISKGWMSSAFGRRVDPISGRMAWHAGVDFAGNQGSDVVAVAAGVVVFAGDPKGDGVIVEINPGGGYVTRYGHHEQLAVSAGDVVKKGQVIGRMGSSGRSTGPHVHFEVLKDGRQVDPARYVARRRAS